MTEDLTYFIGYFVFPKNFQERTFISLLAYVTCANPLLIEFIVIVVNLFQNT